MTTKEQSKLWNTQPTGLKINIEKTKIMKSLENEEDTDDEDEVVIFEKVSEF